MFMKSKYQTNPLVLKCFNGVLFFAKLTQIDCFNKTCQLFLLFGLKLFILQKQHSSGMRDEISLQSSSV